MASNIIVYFYEVGTTPNLLMQREAKYFHVRDTGVVSFSLNITFSSGVNTCNGMKHAQAT